MENCCNCCWFHTKLRRFPIPPLTCIQYRIMHVFVLLCASVPPEESKVKEIPVKDFHTRHVLYIVVVMTDYT